MYDVFDVVVICSLQKMYHMFDVFGMFTCLFSPKMSHVFDVFDVFRPLLDQLVPVFGVFDVFDVFRHFGLGDTTPFFFGKIGQRNHFFLKRIF